MEKIIFFAIPILVTIPVAALLCRILISWKRQVSFGTVLLSAFLVTVGSLAFDTRGDIFTVAFWDESSPKPPDRELMLKIVAFMIITCACPSLGVVHYYQRLIKKDVQGT
jgi:uncharacterized membrane protein